MCSHSCLFRRMDLAKFQRMNFEEVMLITVFNSNQINIDVLSTMKKGQI